MLRRFSPLIKSILTSFICFLFDYALLYGLTEFCRFYYLISAAISFAVANTLNFYLCARWVFPSGSPAAGNTPLFWWSVQWVWR